MDKHITVPMKKETVATLKAGDYVYLTGTVYTARDAAHKRMYEILQEGGELPIDIQPQLLDLGLGAMIGKGKRNQAVIDAIVRNGSVYFAAVGGAGALLSKCITSSEVVAYDDLGTEAIRKLTVENFPVIVVIDKDGNNLYETAIKDYCRMEENA